MEIKQLAEDAVGAQWWFILLESSPNTRGLVG